MNLRVCFIWIAVIALCFCPFAFASEDSPSPFPDDMYISDLPDLPELPELPDLPESNNNVADSITLATPVDIPQESIEAELHSDIGNKDNLNLQTAEPLNDKGESDSVEPIFLPRKDENTSNNKSNKADTDKSLTDALKSENKQNIIEGTWIEKLANIKSLSSFDDKEEVKEDKEDNLENLVKKSRRKNKDGRSNASVFDISGIMLRMNLNQVEKTLKNRGFQKMNAKFTIPNFIKWRNEEACSSQGIVGFERMQSCVNTMAKKAGHEYIYHLKYAKFDSKEEIDKWIETSKKIGLKTLQPSIEFCSQVVKPGEYKDSQSELYYYMKEQIVANGFNIVTCDFIESIVKNRSYDITKKS